MTQTDSNPTTHSTTTTTNTSSGGGAGLGFVTGALVVIVAILAYFVFAGGEAGQDDVNITIEGAGAAVEGAAESVGNAVEGAADAVDTQ